MAWDGDGTIYVAEETAQNAMVFLGVLFDVDLCFILHFYTCRVLARFFLCL